MLLDVGVGVPGVARRVINLHHPHAAFDQPNRHEAAPRGASRAIQLERRLAFLPYIEDIRRLGLHPIRDFHGVDGGVELRILLLARTAEPIELREQVQLSTLLGERELLVVDEGDELFGVEVFPNDLIRALHFIGDERALVHRGQEGAVPQRWAHRGWHVGTQHHETRKIVVSRAKAVGEPRPERGSADLGVAGVHHQHRRLVVWNVGVDRPDHAHVVRALAQMGEQLAYFHAALPVLLEGERRAHQSTRLPLGRDGAARQGLTVVLVEHRLGIERIHLREAAVHEKEDDALGLRGVIERPAGQFPGLIQNPTRPCDRLVYKSREGHHPEATAHPAQRLASRLRPHVEWVHGLPQFTNRNSFELSSTLR